MVNIIIIKGLKFSLEDFQKLDVPDLIINIWSYNWLQHLPCDTCYRYSVWCEQILKEKWKLEYGDFDFAVEKFKKNDRTFVNVGNFSSTNKNDIIILLKQKNKMIYFFSVYFFKKGFNIKIYNYCL